MLQFDIYDSPSEGSRETNLSQGNGGSENSQSLPSSSTSNGSSISVPILTHTPTHTTPAFTWNGEPPDWYIRWPDAQPDSDFDLSEQEAFDDFEWENIARASFVPPLPPTLYRGVPTHGIRLLTRRQPWNLNLGLTSHIRPRLGSCDICNVYTEDPERKRDKARVVAEARARFIVLIEESQSSRRTPRRPGDPVAGGFALFGARGNAHRLVLDAYNRKLRQEEHALRRGMKGMGTGS